MSRFVTSDVASRVFRELTLDPTQRESGGDTFTLAVEVPVSFLDHVEDYTVRFTVDRLPLEVVYGADEPPFTRQGGEIIITTRARLVSDEEAFPIDIQLPPAYERESARADVSIPQDVVDRAIRDHFKRTDGGGQ